LIEYGGESEEEKRGGEGVKGSSEEKGSSERGITSICDS